ncbi:fibronectin type III domain protein [Ancylostoma duodenale]|uniref:Fibronectin type III domain protein n=1 Tax=Ancylostoma duodenale TaxID=51022 RepID=A0A0C2G0E2_9BILA|nr:fibronectin type III domain protein [Ancylostoma duodenale]
MLIVKPRIEKLHDFTKKENEDVEIVCKYGGDGITGAKFVFGSEEYAVVDEENGKELAPADRSQDENGEEGEEEEEDTPAKNFEEDVTSERLSVRAEDNSLILRIRNLSMSDAGLYKCAVSNEAGWAERAFNIAITHPPILRRASDDQVRSFDGNTIHIFCEVSAVPSPSWIWLRDGNEVFSFSLHQASSLHCSSTIQVEADGSSIIIDSEGGRSKLTLQNAAGKNYGSYTCKADNGVGIFTKAIEVIQVFPPAIPEGIDCKKRLYPNYGKCSIDHDLYSDYASRPSRMEFQILETGDDSMGEMDWDEARVISVDFDAEEMVVRNLTPNSQYSVRARAINEAGDSDFCQPTLMETTDPWAPKKPEHVRMECDEVCTVYWEEPNDHGSEITAYRVGVQEFTENEETGEEQNVGSAFAVEVGGDERSLELTHIRPHSSYRVSVAAINAIGTGETEEVEVDTDDAPLSSAESFLTPKLPIIVGVSLLVILIVIDLICYATNRCGLIACFCINCLGRAPRDRKEKDVEAGRGENNRLLDNQASR